MEAQTQTKIKAMTEGGRILGMIREELVKFAEVGKNFSQIEALAQKLIQQHGAVPNFALVPGYHWATCIMKNDEVCHGIPSKDKVILDGDLITIDVGLLYQGFHVDTTASAIYGKAPAEVLEFLKVGQNALDKAISQAVIGNSVYDVSSAMQKTVERHGYGAVHQLTGHGISKQLHEDPSIPCVAIRRDKRVLFFEGQTVAIEIMYTMGKPDLYVDADGWTQRTVDGSLSGMIEHTVLITKNGPQILTAY